MIIRPKPRPRLWRPGLVVPDRRNLVGAARAGASGAAGRLVAGGPPGTLKDSSIQSINADLVFCLGSHPAGSEFLGKDLVGGGTGTVMTNGDLAGTSPINAEWLCHESDSTSNGGIYFDDADIDALDAITTDFTLMVVGERDSEIAGSRSISRQHTTSQASDDPVLSLARNSTTTSMRVFKKIVSGGRADVVCDTGSWPAAAGSLEMLAATASGTTITAYVNGSASGATKTIAAGNVDFSGGQPLAIANRSATSQQEGLDGRTGFAAIWSRALSAGEISTIWSDPLTMFWT